MIDGHLASLILVVARGPDGVGLYAVEGDASGLERTQMATMDETRKMARLEFTGVPARRVDAGWEQVAHVLDRAAVALAAEQAGGAARCLEMATEYANERVQFGRQIGSFQAVKHKLANLLMEVESAKSAAYYAGWTVGEAADELPTAAPLAKAYLLRRVPARLCREHPGARRHRRDLGAPRAPLLQAREDLGAAAGARAAGGQAGHLAARANPSRTAICRSAGNVGAFPMHFMVKAPTVEDSLLPKLAVRHRDVTVWTATPFEP